MSRQRHIELDGRRIPWPKCILCDRRCARTWIPIFQGNISVAICYVCILPRDVEKRCEQKVVEIYGNEDGIPYAEKEEK